MLETKPRTKRAKTEALETAALDAEVDAEVDLELAEVYGGKGAEDLHFRSKWYVSGCWPFRRISFECPGCSRWLSVARSHSARTGFCPSCRLTLATPDPALDLPPALISTAKEIPALPARHLPDPRQSSVATKSNPSADFARFGAINGEEGDWGIREDNRLAPINVVTRFQSITPWATIAGLVLAASLLAKSFMGMRPHSAETETTTTTSAKKQPQVPLSSELWVVLDSLTTASTPESIATLVRNPKEMLPKMQAYYAEHPSIELPHRFERAQPGLKVYEIGDKKFARFEGRCDGSPVKFSFEATPHGWRLDWESLVGYSEQNWSDYLTSRPEKQQQFRLLAKVSTDELINFNREQYICMQLTDRLETGIGFALIDRFGLSAQKLNRFLQLTKHGGNPSTWITPILRPLNGSDELFEIVDVKSGSWLIP